MEFLLPMSLTICLALVRFTQRPWIIVILLNLELDKLFAVGRWIVFALHIYAWISTESNFSSIVFAQATCRIQIFAFNVVQSPLSIVLLTKISSLSWLILYHTNCCTAALRGLFIIDPEGIIRSIQINDDAVGRSVEETLRILKAFQWADSHVGESNWSYLNY